YRRITQITTVENNGIPGFTTVFIYYFDNVCTWIHWTIYSSSYRGRSYMLMNFMFMFLAIDHPNHGHRVLWFPAIDGIGETIFTAESIVKIYRQWCSTTTTRIVDIKCLYDCALVTLITRETQLNTSDWIGINNVQRTRYDSSGYGIGSVQ